MQIVKTLSMRVREKLIGLIKSTKGMKLALTKRACMQKQMQKLPSSHCIWIFTS